MRRDPAARAVHGPPRTRVQSSLIAAAEPDARDLVARLSSLATPEDVARAAADQIVAALNGGARTFVLAAVTPETLLRVS